jgi:hypothetical protein
LANLHSQYLETEAAKVSYFNEKLRLPLAILPCRRYTGLKSASHTDRYFVNRFPIFISRLCHLCPRLSTAIPTNRTCVRTLLTCELMSGCGAAWSASTSFIVSLVPRNLAEPRLAFHSCSLRRQRSIRNDWPGILRFGSCGKPTKPARSPAPTGIFCAMATSDIRQNPLSPPTRNGHPVACPERSWNVTYSSSGHGLRRHSRPRFCRQVTTFSGARWTLHLDRQPKTKGPVRGPVCGPFKWNLSAWGTRIQSWSENNTDAAKNVSWPGATPFWPRVSRPKSLRGSLPATVSTEIRFFRACAPSVSVLMLPRILGSFCQGSLANLARTLGHALPETHLVREGKHRAFAQATSSAAAQESQLARQTGDPSARKLAYRMS